MGFFAKLSRSKSAVPPVFTLPRGETEVEVYGDQYRNRTLATMFARVDSQIFNVALTPICDYQIKKGWPKAPFVNVNLSGSRKTTVDNWLGYVPFGYGGNLDYENMLTEHGVVEASARIDKRGRSYELVLLIVADMEVSVQHDKLSQKVLNIIANHNYESIKCDLVEETVANGKDKGKMRYRVDFRDHKVGQISVMKSSALREYLQGYEYSARLSLRYYDEHPTYSRMVISRN